MRERSVVVVGAGLVGLGVARALVRARPHLRVTVIDKEPGVAQHQSSHNSGVLHAGLYYRPGSLRARLAVRGIRMMVEFCRAHGVRHDVCGKIVVATDDDEVGRLRGLHERGTANGLSDLRWLAAGEVAEREPHVRAAAALLVPEEGIADYPGVARAMAAELGGNGVTLQLGHELRAMRRGPAGWQLTTDGASGSAEIACDFVITCAGLQSDRVARLAGERPKIRIVPFRGDYFAIRPESRVTVRHLVYPVPDPRFPFLGVHFTRMIDGGVECGPSAVLAFSREGYRRAAFSLTDAMSAAGFPGLWRFAWRYPGPTAWELWRAWRVPAFVTALRRLVPGIGPDDIVRGPCGIRAQAMLPNGLLVDDFVFGDAPRALHVLNAPSPAATASLAIGEHVAERAAAAIDAL